ncbi:hypothetical protein BC937DRAFT_92334 [Endogone sp. FLAS-F59071]|nr:hypothetical protein BC937DRAFT_92334 [Endogone sp. FLAS-F59071]|eukprot:RUS15543.1 hypothetical protein BC937DRAFT_92334 [Endogone sp. FLAS-F59071]
MGIFFPTHSSLSELRSFVRLFSPSSVSPTVLDQDYLTCPDVVERFRDLLSHGEGGTTQKDDATCAKDNEATAAMQGREREQGRKRKREWLGKSLLKSGNEAESASKEGYEGEVELETENDEMVEATLTNTTTMATATDITMQSLESVRGEEGEDRENYSSAGITIAEEYSYALVVETSEDDDDCYVVKQATMRKGTGIVPERGYASEMRMAERERGDTLLDPIMLSDEEKSQGVKRKKRTLTMREAKAEVSEWVKRLHRTCPEVKGSADACEKQPKEVIVVDDPLSLELDPVERESTPLVLTISSSVLSPTSSLPSDEPGPLVLEQDSDSSQSVDMELVERIRSESEATGRGPLLDCCRR